MSIATMVKSLIEKNGEKYNSKNKNAREFYERMKNTGILREEPYNIRQIGVLRDDRDKEITFLNRG